MAEARVLGLLPARGGSKGVPGKNLRPLLGRPLLAWAASALAQATTPLRRICSTDDAAIATVARAAGLETPWLRPPAISGDTALVVDVIAHALRSLDDPMSHVALVQATSPTVTSDDIDAAVRLALDSGADTVISGFSAGQRHPATMYRVGPSGEVRWLLDADQRMARRQDLPPVFIRTGLIYVMRSELVLERRSLYGERIVALEIPEARALTIDDERDFKLAEYMLKERDHD